MQNKPLLADQAIEKLIANYQFTTVLDVGCGEGLHSARLQKADKSVTAIDYHPRISGVIAADYVQHSFKLPFDCIWVSHVLEHQPNVQQFLTKIHADLREGGILAITVPPLKHAIVGGHLTLWNAGLLLYNLILAGFDCRSACCKRYGYNISVITSKVTATLNWDDLRFANGDIEKLAQFFPNNGDFTWRQSFDGNFREINWDCPQNDRRHKSKPIWRRLLKRAA